MFAQHSVQMKGARNEFRAPTGDTTKERQPLRQSTDQLATTGRIGRQARLPNLNSVFASSLT
jgi:hypothetical protein